MKRLITVLCSLLLLLACSKAPESPQPVAQAAPFSVAWIKPDGANIAPIFAQAKATNIPVFLYWGAAWCPPCNQIKATVFSRHDFIERSQLFVPVYLDGDTPGAQKLGTKFKVHGYPTMILFKPDGTELTRLPGEVDASQYMEVLGLGLATSQSVKQLLATALGSAGTALSPDAWRLLAYYSWDQDQAQLVPPKALTVTLHRLAQTCPVDQSEAAARLSLKAIVASAKDKTALPDRPAAMARVQKILGDTRLARQNLDVLVNYATDMVPTLSPAGNPDHGALLAQWNALLDQFASDASLSKADRLSAVAAKVALAKLDSTKHAKPTLDAALLSQVRAAAATADKSTSNPYERQAVIPNAADLLSEAGLLDESDALLKAELPKAVSPYYHMLVLAANAKSRGDTAASLDWAEKAWGAAKGPATRLQWGSGYVNRLLEWAPQDAARIEKAASGVLTELEAVPETFYERNRRSLEKMGQRLNTWNKQGQHQNVLGKLTAQLDAVCAKMPPQDAARRSCEGIFKSHSNEANT